MIPGPDIFYKCPKCGAYLYTHSLTSGNTLGARTYSDGKMEAPMLPEYPNITSCGECGTIVMLNRLESLSEEALCQSQEGGSLISLWRKLKSLIFGTVRPAHHYYECQPLTINDLNRAIDVFPEEELSIRLRIWRIFNNEVRPYADLHLEHISAIGNLLDSKEYQSNCLALLSLLNKNNPQERIVLAELNRNLGNFTECMELIPKSERNGYMGKILALECERGNRYTVRIDNYYEILEAKAKQESERKEQERINEEMKDPRWKICPKGHCYENIRKECVWCGENNVVGRLDKDVSLQHRDLYVGKLNGHYILTSDANVPMQEERIRKITVDYYQDKFIYFHLDGKNPNPFYFNKIKLNQGYINGRIITKICEDIVAGKISTVDLSSYIQND